MGLPAELLPYAENLYRRFPEEFIALGMPGLENAFDLRPSGSWTRSIRETPTEKTVEITIRRWTAPSIGGPYPPNPWYQPGYGASPYAQGGPQASPYAQGPQAGPYAQAGPYGQGPYGPQMLPFGPQPGQCPPYAGPGPAPAPPAPSSAGEVERLGRLESALSLLKPQIEALITMQGAGRPAPQEAPAAPLQGASTPPLPVPDGVASGGGTPPMPGQGGGVLTLKDRRNVANLQIQTVPKAKPVEPPSVAQAFPAQQQQQPPPPQTQSQQPSQMQQVPRQGTAKYTSSMEGRRPTVNINAVRVAPTALDPSSPRSPDAFSAWK